MQPNQYLFEPDTRALWTWFFIGLLLLLLCLFLMVKFSRRKSGVNKKFSPLLFLLSGMFMLITMTITSFMGFNLFQTKTVKIDGQKLDIGEQAFELDDIRRTYIHREGSGIPFKGLGANQGTDNSLIIEFSNDRSVILSEDFYPLEEIVEAIQKLKKKAQ